MKSGSTRVAARPADMPQGGAGLDAAAAVIDRLPSCAQSCVSPSSFAPACEGDLGCACETPEFLGKVAHCFSSSCNADDLSIAIGEFSREICLAVPQDIVSPTGWSPPELRRKLRRRDTPAARTMAIARRGNEASENQQRAEEKASVSTFDKRTAGSAGLSTGAEAGIAIAAVAVVALIAGGIFIYLRRRKPSIRKVTSLEAGKKPTSRKERQRQKQLDAAHKKEQEQLQQQLQQMQQELQQQKLQEQEARKIKLEQQQKEESKYVAELFELPGWMPERQPTPMNELADTGQPRYEMMTEANTAEMGSGYPEREDDDDRIYDHYPRRSRSYTAELSGGIPVIAHDSSTDDDGELTPLKRSHSDTGPIISPADHISHQMRSPFDISPPTATIPGMVFSRSDWRSGGGAQVQTPVRSPMHPAVPLGLTVDTTRALAATGKRAKGQGVGMPSADIASERRREAWQ